MKRRTPPHDWPKRRLEVPKPDSEECLLATVEAIRALDDARALAPRGDDVDAYDRLKGIDSQLWNLVEDLQEATYGDGDGDQE